jgi:hypothetical protein
MFTAPEGPAPAIWIGRVTVQPRPRRSRPGASIVEATQKVSSMKHRLFLSMAIGVPGRHGWLAFAGDAAGHPDIRTITPDSSGATNITDAADVPATQGG